MSLLIHDALASADIHHLLRKVVDIVSTGLEADHALILEINAIDTDSCFSDCVGWDRPTSISIGRQLDAWARQPVADPPINTFPGADLVEADILKPPVEFIREQGLRDALFVSAPCRDGRIMVLAGHSGQESVFSQKDAHFLHSMMKLLCLTIEWEHAELMSFRNLQLAVQAKQQWESTLDALPQLMCLIDEDGHVIRANRTLEVWKLGEVRVVRGSEVHEVVHPDCHDVDCGFKQRWLDMWWQLEDADFAECEFHDHYMERDLRCSLCRGGKSRYEDSEQAEGYALLVLEDISEKKQEERILRDYNEELEKSLQERTLELTKMNIRLRGEVNDHMHDKEALRCSQKELQIRSEQLIQTQEAERKRIASELHDSIGQQITAVKFSLENTLREQTDNLPSSNRDYLSGVIAKLRDTVEEVRKISMDLRPPMLDDLGLLATIRWFCREYSSAFPQIRLDEQMEVSEKEIPESIKVVIFRLLQEALNNTGKHAQASHVSIRLSSGGGRLVFQIEDDGQGFSLEAMPDGKGYGLASMKERAKLSGGLLVIDPTPGKGTLIQAAWPL